MLHPGGHVDGVRLRDDRRLHCQVSRHPHHIIAPARADRYGGVRPSSERRIGRHGNLIFLALLQRLYFRHAEGRAVAGGRFDRQRLLGAIGYFDDDRVGIRRAHDQMKHGKRRRHVDGFDDVAAQLQNGRRRMAVVRGDHHRFLDRAGKVPGVDLDGDEARFARRQFMRPSPGRRAAATRMNIADRQGLTARVAYHETMADQIALHHFPKGIVFRIEGNQRPGSHRGDVGRLRRSRHYDKQIRSKRQESFHNY